MYRKRISFLLLFVCLLMLVYVKEPPKNPVQKSIAKSNELQEESEAGPIRNETRKKLIPLGVNEKITSISFSDFQSKEKFRFERKNNDWVMTVPVCFPALATILNAMVNLIEMSERGKPFRVRQSENTNEYGFSKPAFQICIATDQNSNEKCLLLGNPSPLLPACYAKFESENEIFLLDFNFRTAFENRTPYSLLQKQVFPFALRAAERLEIQYGGQSAGYYKKANEWYLENSAEPLSGEEIEKLLGALNYLHIREFVNGDSNDPDFGFETNVKGKIRVKFSNGWTQILFLGREVPVKFGYYGRLADWPNIFLISKEKLDEILAISEQMTNPPANQP